jgi:hypothetical protein
MFAWRVYKCSHDARTNVQHRVFTLITEKIVKHNVKYKICFTPLSNVSFDAFFRANKQVVSGECMQNACALAFEFSIIVSDFNKELI